MDAWASRVGVYVGGGVRWLRPRFQAGFTDGFGNVDRTTVSVNLVCGAAFTGITWGVRGPFTVSAQLYAVPADVTTTRVAAQLALP